MDAASHSLPEGAILKQSFLTVWLFHYIFNLLWCSLRFWRRSCVIDVAARSEYPEISHFLYFYPLWFYLMVSLCCKKKLLRWRVTSSFICEHKNTFLNCSSELHWVRNMMTVGFPLRYMTLLAPVVRFSVPVESALILTGQLLVTDKIWVSLLDL